MGRRHGYEGITAQAILALVFIAGWILSASDAGFA